MIKINVLCFYVNVVFIIGFLNAADVGDSCRAARSGAPGTCKIIEECTAVIDEIVKQRLFPSVCGFLGRKQVVCCPNPATTTTTPRSTGPKRISQLKCIEYQRAVYENVSVTIGFGQPPTIRQVPKCAFSNVPLVVGGEAANPKEFPHMVVVGYQEELKDEPTWGCGGTLISENFVLTAAHCINLNKILGQPKYALLGDYILDRTDDDAQTLQVNIVNIYIHPQFRASSKYYDIALLRLDRNIRFNQYMRPACLPDTFNTNTRKVIVSGWGKTGYRDGASNVLMKVVLELFTQEECTVAYSRESRGTQLQQGIVETQQFCAGSHTEKKDACQGDSGGPAQIFHPTLQCIYVVSGVTSFGKACGEAHSPGVYTRVYNFLDWIEGYVWPNQ